MRFFSDFFCKIVSKCLGKVSSCAKNQEDMVDDVSTKKVHTARIFGWFFKSTGTFIRYSRVINLQVENFHFNPINNLGVTLRLLRHGGKSTKNCRPSPHWISQEGY